MRANAPEAARYGELALVLFLVAQGLDGILTYVGVGVFGHGAEANPLLAWLIATLGAGPALTAAKLASSMFGVLLHAAALHRAVLWLAALHYAVAIGPWTYLLLYA